MKTISYWLNTKRNTSLYSDIEIVLQHVLNKDRAQLYLTEDYTLTDIENKKVDSLMRKREKGIPLAYVLKQISFFKNQFYIEEGVFIPRPESEILVESVLSKFKTSSQFYFLDLGCGSGGIGLSLLLKFKKAHLIAVDLNKKALEITQKNAVRHSIDDRLTLIQKDVSLLDINELPHPIPLVVANPPYIAKGDPMLNVDVHNTEPHLALYSENDGFKAIDQWIHKVASFFSLNKEKKAYARHYFFEIGYNQSNRVREKVNSYSCIKKFHFYKDLKKIDRVAHCQFG